MKSKGPIWIDERDALAIHEGLLAIHGSAAGLRDLGLLQSALARPRQHHIYAKRPDIVAMAAVYTAGIVRNNPFVDGNKRAGFVLGILLLELNGIEFGANEENATRAVLDLADGTMDESAYEGWLRANSKRLAR